MPNLHERDESLFYCDVQESEVTNRFIEPLKVYSLENSKQVYILEKVLGTTKEYNYDISDIVIVLVPKHPVLLLSYGRNEYDELEDYLLDFKEDLGALSSKFDYDKILGRARKWPKEFFEIKKLEDLDISEFLQNEIDTAYNRKIDLLISLLIGSINSVDKVGIDEPQTLLEKVKQKIILFDGQQSRFIYQTKDQYTVTIQGMAGTGKTELLLHKLKDVYSNEKDSVIAFTCHNKVLANDLKTRIPQFFNFLKVEEQIEWNKRLHVFSSWGSANNPHTGLYSYICNKYKLHFSNYGENHNFNSLCQEAFNSLNKIDDFEPCFDYIFIDESQDFKESFFELCKKVTRKTVYIAGDIFQNIFDTSINTDIKPDFLLNKCYRTDPKTLMFAHAVGMGLYESPQINWLDDDAWISCGYYVDRNTTDQQFILGRKPLRRFEDLDATNTIRLSMCEQNEYSEQILSSIEEIVQENPSVRPEDIAVIILGDYKGLCSIADKTAHSLYKKYEWESTRGYETKSKSSDKVYISNVNNIKGLEFPFIICVVPNIISNNILMRNSIYMALTRSFLTSYFIIDKQNNDFYALYSEAIKKITDEGVMKLHEPSAAEREEMVTNINITLSTKRKTPSQIIDEILTTEYSTLDKFDREFVRETIGKVANNLTEEQIRQKISLFVDDIMGDNMS